MFSTGFTLSNILHFRVSCQSLLYPGDVPKPFPSLMHCFIGCRSFLVSGFPLTDSEDDKFGHLVLRISGISLG